MVYGMVWILLMVDSIVQTILLLYIYYVQHYRP